MVRGNDSSVTEKDSFKDMRVGNNGTMKHNQHDVWHDVALQKLKNNAQKIRSSLVDHIDSQLACMVDDFKVGDGKPETKEETSDQLPKKKRDSNDLPDKEFIIRDSLLTELFKINHIQTIYHIFVSILMILFLNTVLYDIVETGTLSIDIGRIFHFFGKPQLVLTTWIMMKLCSLIVYPAFYFWAHHRHHVHSKKLYDSAFLLAYMLYMCNFLYFPARVILGDNLPEASSAIVVCEQVRLIMKVYAFVRTNIPRAKLYKPHQDGDAENDIPCPDFGKYLYFLFAPTLVYRDDYPRTQTIRWSYVVSNFIQVVACLFYTHYVFQRYCVPVYQKFGHQPFTYTRLLLAVFSSMLPATLVMLIFFFAILHSWLNAFAEMLRFGDRLFYKDWWNSTTYANYYRTWNIVVHDWLYTYVYRDFFQLLRQNRTGSMMVVFLLSALVHEYMVAMLFHFFCPIMFFLFGGLGVFFVFLTDKRKSRSWNVFMWTSLFMGTGLFMSIYSMEIYARMNCLPFSESEILDFFVPRLLVCQPVHQST